MPESDDLQSLIVSRARPSFDKLMEYRSVGQSRRASGEIFLHNALACRAPRCNKHSRTAMPPSGTEQLTSLSQSSGAHTSVIVPSPGALSETLRTVKLGFLNLKPHGLLVPATPGSRLSHR